MNSAVIQAGIAAAKEATERDRKLEYEAAKALYIKAVELLLRGLQETKALSPAQRQGINVRAKTYVARAEALKTALCLQAAQQQQLPPQAQQQQPRQSCSDAIRQARNASQAGKLAQNKGEFQQALDLYFQSLQYYMQEIRKIPSGVRIEEKHALMAEAHTLANRVERTQAHNDVEIKGGVTFADVAGMDAAKIALSDAVIFPQCYPSLFEGAKSNLQPKGVLMYGPPGTGKHILVACFC
jgi:ATP-dependent 26S proteasome regulatory subunit